MGNWFENKDKVLNAVQNLSSDGLLTGGAHEVTNITASSQVSSEGFMLSPYYKADKVTILADTTGIMAAGWIELSAGSASTVVTYLGGIPGTYCVVSCSNATNTASVQLGGSNTFDGTNNKATFTAAGQAIVFFCLGSRYILIKNNGATLSAV